MQEVINQLQQIAQYLPLMGLVVIGLVGVWMLVKLVLKVLELRWLLKRKVTYFELTPLAFTDKSPRATKQLFSVLHGLGGSHSLKDRLLGRKAIFALEITSSREQGIRYILQVNKSEAASYHKAITGYLPEIGIKEIKDVLPTMGEKSTAKVVTFKQSGNFAFPLQPQQSLEDYDPIAHLTAL
jgi:hypothetical protein